VVKKNTLNYEALDYDKPIHPQFQEQIGRGNRLAVGKICGRPLTHDDNLKLFAALDIEKATPENGKAAAARLKSANMKPLPGDDIILEAYEKHKLEEAKVKLVHARAREAKGEATKADSALIKSRLAKKIDGRGAQPPKQTKRRLQAQDVSSDDESCTGSGSAAELVYEDGRDLVGKVFEDPDLGLCTVLKKKTYRGDYTLEYSYEEGGETDVDFSSVEEVRGWVASFHLPNI